MPRLVRALVLAGFLAGVDSLQAGVYFTNNRKPFDFLSDPFPVVTAQESVKIMVGRRTTTFDDVAKAVKEDRKKEPEDHANLVREVETVLEPKRKMGGITLDDRINLSAAYIRLGRYPKAVDLLKETLESGQVKEDAPERFLLLANLASAYHGHNDTRSAKDFQRQAVTAAAGLKVPPVAGWSPQQWNHLRVTESYYLYLLELRDSATGATSALDDLFPRVRFGAGNKYEAGKLAPDSLALPRDALGIVVQLIAWEPRDARLKWLFGELLNADGRVLEAYREIDNLVFTNQIGGDEIKAHRRVLRAAAATEKKAPEAVDEVVPAPEPKQADTKPAPATPLPNWRSLGTGFLAGFLVALFGFVQVYLWSRRRRPAPTADTALRDNS